MRLRHFIRTLLLALGLGGCFLPGVVRALELQAERHQPDDLALAGPFAGIPAGATRYLARQEMARLPGVIQLHEKLTPSLPEAELTVLPLPVLLDVLPPAPGTDGVLLTCADRWQSVLPLAFIHAYAPYLLLYYDGRSPAEGWPMFSKVEAFAPYYVNVSSVAHPEFNGVIDEGMISGTQVIELRAINVRQHYEPFYAGALAHLSKPAEAGRKIFIRECNNCHQGPGGVGGNTSQRPLVLLQTHATLNEDFFRKMVRRPRDFYPDTVMPSHEHFGEETFGPLIAFLRESRAADPAGPP
jgi:cytochrome c2